MSGLYWAPVGTLPPEYQPSFYGIRGHRYDYDAHHLQAAARMTLELELDQINRPAAELLFDMCLKCQTLTLADCECHERGYN